MTREDDFIRQLEAYLDDHDGLTPLPDAVRNAVRTRVPATRQFGARWGRTTYLRMTLSLPAPARYGLVAAAVIAAVALGASYLDGGPRIGGDPEPTASPTPTPTVPALDGGSLEPGTYAIAAVGLDATFTVPAGWSNLDRRGVAKDSATDGTLVVIFWPFPNDFTEVYTDPCNWSTNIIEPPVGPTVDDLADALAAQADRGDAVPVDVTVDGYEGKYLEMSVPDDINLAECDQGRFTSWRGRYHQGPGQIDNVYILDVDGVRQVLISHHMPGATAAELAEQQAVFGSIDINP